MNKNKKFRGKTRTKRPKEVEINIDRDDINKADLDEKRSGSFRKGKDKKNRAHENDISWYNHYPEYLSNVSNINYGYQLGSKLDYKVGGAYPGVNVFSPTTAGILTIDFVPTFGSAEGTVDSPINKVAIQMYAAERQKLGSRADYEANDNIMYFGAMDSAYLVYALGAKIYGCLRQSSPFNNYFMHPMLESMRCDYDSFATNMSDFRATINQFAIFLNSRLIPDSFDIFKRHMWLMTNMFMDSDTPKAQIYNFMLEGYYTYTEVTDGPSKLAYKALPRTGTNSKFTLGDYKNLVNSITVSLLNSTDIDQMSADIGKAFENSVFNLSLIPEEYMTPITYSKEVLSQIENITLTGNVISGDIIQEMTLPQHVSPRVKQDLMVLIWNNDQAETVAALKGGWTCKRSVNLHIPNPNEQDSMIATRGIVIPKSISVEGGKVVMIVGPRGTEVFTVGYMTYFNADKSLTNNSYTAIMVPGNAVHQAMMSKIAVWSQFDWAPSITYVAPDNKTLVRFQDIDMYSLVDSDQISEMHVCALFSEFYSDKFMNIRM